MPIWTLPLRGLTRDRGLLDDPLRGGSFTRNSIENIKRLSDFDLFWRNLEGSPHNDAHIIVGALASGDTGHMGRGLAPLDPIFWLHHCMVDRIWAEWQTAGNTTPDPGRVYDGQFSDEFGSLMSVTAAESHDIAALGFTYDVLTEADAEEVNLLRKSLSADEQATLAARLAEAKARRLGRAKNDKASAVEIATSIKVNTDSLVPELLSSRPFRPTDFLSVPRFAVEGRRILAKLTNVMAPEGGGDVIVNVFVNCPYLSPSTPTVDPYFAGSFSFFRRMTRYEFVVDISEPLRAQAAEGRLPVGATDVQLMPLSAAPQHRQKGEFMVGNVEVISV